MQFKKNEFIIAVMDSNFAVWLHTNDTKKYVPETYLEKLDKFIFNNMKQQLKEAEIYYLLWLQDQGFKLSLWQKLKIAFSGLRPVYESEMREQLEALARVVNAKPSALELKPDKVEPTTALAVVDNVGVPVRGSSGSVEPTEA